MKLAISCPAGLEGVCKRELSRLFNIEGKAVNGRITFEGSMEDIGKCNLFLRTASRVYIEVGEFKVSNFDELYDGIKSIYWEDYIHHQGLINIQVKLVESSLTAISATCSVCKKAIYDRITKRTHKQMDESGERYKIEVVIHRDFAKVYIDTSGDGLHKRGYRELVGEAPLKENVAASLIDLSVWNPSRPLADVFCGSGTIAIEAALKGLGIPPGINRDFDFLHYRFFDVSFFERMKEAAMCNVDFKKELCIYAIDIDESQIKLARHHAKNAGVESYIHFQRMDMRDFTTKKKNGIIISNPPYGERLMSREEIVSLYRDYGKMFNNLDNWCNYTITAAKDFEKLFGKRADKKRKVYNGKIECTYYSFLGEPPKKI